MDLTAQYNQLVHDNRTLKEMVRTRDSEIARLREENARLGRFRPSDITMDDFLSYLGLPFTLDAMPRASGIYAYYHPVEDLLYVGQSKNMYNRLRQHFNRGRKTTKGHDSEFNDPDEWQFYVIEYIDRDDKALLDDREALWIALAKVATSNREIVDTAGLDRMADLIMEGRARDIGSLEINHRTIEVPGQVTNRTRGNNVWLT